MDEGKDKLGSTQPVTDLSETERKLSDQELQIVADQSGLFIMRYELHTHRAERFYNSNEVFGIPVIDENLPESMIERGMIANESIAGYRRIFDDMQKGIPFGSADSRIKNAAGEDRWLHLKYSLVYDNEGNTTHSIITFFDITKQREMQLAHEKWRSGLSVMIANSLLYVEVNLTQNKIELQEGKAKYSRKGDAADSFDDFLHYGFENLVVDDDGMQYCEFFDRKRLMGLFAGGVSEDTLVYRVRADDDGTNWVRANIHMTQYPFSDDVIAIVGYEDIDRQQRKMEQLALMASHDSLTGIYNREALKTEISAQLLRLDEDDIAALFMIDLDNFKQVNDNLGHKCGDELLIRIAASLQEIFAGTGVVGRLGGDEFMAFVSGRFTRQQIEQLAAKAINMLQFCMNTSKFMNISTSIGIALHHNKEEFESLYIRADSALYVAKNEGKCRYCFFAGAESGGKGFQEKDNGDIQGTFQLQTVMEYLGGGIALAKLSGTDLHKIDIVYVSPSFFKSLKYDYDVVDVHKEQLFSYVVEEDLPELYSVLRKTAITGEMTEFVYRLKMPGTNNRAWRLIHVTSMPSGSDDYRMIIGFISDITNIVSGYKDEV